MFEWRRFYLVGSMKGGKRIQEPKWSFCELVCSPPQSPYFMFWEYMKAKIVTEQASIRESEISAKVREYWEKLDPHIKEKVKSESKRVNEMYEKVKKLYQFDTKDNGRKQKGKKYAQEEELNQAMNDIYYLHNELQEVKGQTDMQIEKVLTEMEDMK